jgi:putative ABC transport system permease protein
MAELDMDRRRSLSDRLYAVALRAFPPSFRREAGLDMAETFRDLCREVRAERGARGLAGLWLRTVVDVARNAPPERLRALAEAHRRPRPERRRSEERLLEALLQDLRYAARSLRKRPGFAAVTLLTLALGLGANTAIFSVLHALLLTPLPYPEPERVAFVWGKSGASAEEGVSWPDFEELRAHNRSFEALAVVRSQSVNLTGGETPERVTGTFTTASLLSRVLGAAARSGRLFTDAESEPPGAAPVAVLAHGLWQRRFGGDPAVLGQQIILNGTPFQVIGILPPDFELNLLGGTWPTDVFLPIAYYPNRNGLTREDRSLFVVGRLRPGVATAQAEADLAVTMAALEKEHPSTNTGLGTRVVPLHEVVVGEVRPALVVLQAAAGIVLLIACCNVANLFLLRAAERRREIALRAALGAGGGRILRQLLTESVLLASLAGLLGLALAHWGVRALVALAPDPQALAMVRLDGTVFGLSLLAAVLTGLALGIVPASLALDQDLGATLKEGARSLTGGRGRLREWLVVSEVALSLVALIGAGLLLQSLRRMQQLELGFRPEKVLTLSFRLPPAKYPEGPAVAAFLRAAAANVRAVPGIESAALVRAVPLSGNFASSGYVVEGRPEPRPGEEPQALTNIVTPDYFRTMGIRLHRGRDFTEHDDSDAPPVAVISASLAARAWPDEDPVGRRLRVQGSEAWLTVVGVVDDVKHRKLSDPPQAQLYTTHDQDPKIFACVVARTAQDPLALADAVRKAIWAVDKDQPVWSVTSLEALLANKLAPTRFLLTLLAGFAAIAVALAAVGIYGVLSYAVAQRRQEIGIRVALGARAPQVVRLVVGRGMLLTGAAIALGLAAAAGVARLMSALLFDVAPTDAATFGTAAGVLAAVALAACWGPARRAARVDPAATLAQK